MSAYTAGMLCINVAGSKGSLGCFAHIRGDPAARVLLGSGHALFGGATELTNIEVYAGWHSSCCRGTPIARMLNSWRTSFKVVSVNVTTTPPSPAQTGAETDCAIARLVDGIAFSNVLPMIGPISGTPPAGDLGIVAGPPPGTAPSLEQYVRFYCPQDDQIRFGTIVRPTVGVTAAYSDGRPVPNLLLPFAVADDSDKERNAVPNINQILILPRVPPGESIAPLLASGAKLTWMSDGDSGSVVVNHLNQVIGVTTRSVAASKLPLPQNVDEFRVAKSFGFVCPIQSVLDQMNIEIPPNFASTTPSAGAAVRIFASGFAGPGRDAARERRTAALRERLRATRKGRLILGKISQHQAETWRLVTGVRPVTVAWHRNQGPAFMQHLNENAHDAGHVVPTSINGITQLVLVRTMAAMFVRYGSPRLRRDVERYSPWLSPWLFDELGSIASLDDVPRALAHERVLR
jgi:hypothetical protein